MKKLSKLTVSETAEKARVRIRAHVELDNFGRKNLHPNHSFYATQSNNFDKCLRQLDIESENVFSFQNRIKNVFFIMNTPVTCQFVLRHFNRCNFNRCYFNRSHFQPLAFSTACLFDRLPFRPLAFSTACKFNRHKFDLFN